jgi:transcriptional regulator with XRE-family HTH domain
MTQYISSSQLRGARGLLNWTRAELSERSGVSEPTLHRIENDQSKANERTLNKLRSTLENAGIEFLGNNGAQIRRDIVYALDDIEGFKKLMDDVYAAACDPSALDGSKPICICNVDDRLFMKYLGDYMLFHVQRMNDLKKVKVRILVRSQDFYKIPDSPYIEYRWGAKEGSGSVPFYVYGDKLAILMFNENQAIQIIVISSAMVAKAYREQFEILWQISKTKDKAKEKF